MKRIISMVFVCAACGGASSTATAPKAATAATAGTLAVPDALKPPADQALVLRAKAVGAQVYVCGQGKDDPSKYEWTLKAPDAELFDDGGQKIGKHYAGPTWESTDGSKVVGAMKAKDPGPDATAIPWLLVESKSNAGSGVFAKVASIQRLETVGGKAPAEGCSQATAGKELPVPYRATYYFYSAK